jgi:hypothetical protein
MPVIFQYRENEAMIDRRTLLRALLVLGPFTVLVSACRRRGPYDPKEEPLKREGGGY